jgi:UDP-2,3-diacylglucosamine pyrophosphatase LpxH
MSERVIAKSRLPLHILLSDIHLGADLVHHVRPRDERGRAHASAIDRRLSALFDYHGRPNREPVRFVIAGDFVDFIGMSLPAPADRSVELTAEERRHGLGSTKEHAVIKVQAVAERHAPIFAAMARALIAGHELVIVRGNHDVEWHWGRARRAFVAALSAHARSEREARIIDRAVTFHDWFYYVKDVLFVEHGHEYDPMCSFGDPLLPLCARDPSRMRLTPSNVLNRYVVRPTPGVATSGHETASFSSYLQLAASLGLRGGLALAGRFARAAGCLLWSALLSRRQRLHIERARDSRLRALARRHGLSADLLSDLSRLHVKPAAQSVRALMRGLYLDRLLLIACVGLALLFAWSSMGALLAAQTSALSLSVALVTGRLTGRGRDIDPARRMRAGAAEIARQLGVRYVVMGHTHAPCFDRIAARAHYVNLGNWGDDELPAATNVVPSDPPCTYLEVTDDGAGPTARLMRWVEDRPVALVVAPSREREREGIPGECEAPTCELSPAE